MRELKGISRCTWKSVRSSGAETQEHFLEFLISIEIEIWIDQIEWFKISIKYVNNSLSSLYRLLKFRTILLLLMLLGAPFSFTSGSCLTCVIIVLSFSRWLAPHWLVNGKVDLLPSGGGNFATSAKPVTDSQHKNTEIEQ